MNVAELLTKLGFTIDQSKLKEYDNLLKKNSNASVEYEKKASTKRNKIVKDELELNKKEKEKQDEYIYKTQAKIRKKAFNEEQKRLKDLDKENEKLLKKKEKEEQKQEKERQKRLNTERKEKEKFYNDLFKQQDKLNKNQQKQDEYTYKTQYKIRQQQQKNFEEKRKQEEIYQNLKLKNNLKNEYAIAKQQKDVQRLGQLQSKINEQIFFRGEAKNKNDLAFNQMLASLRLRTENEINRLSNARNKASEQSALLQYQKRKDALMALTTVGSGVYRGSSNIIKSSFQTYGDFEEALIRTRANTGGSKADYKKLEKQAMALGFKTRFDALEVAQAQETLSGQGYNVKELMAMLPHVLSVSSITKKAPKEVSTLMSEMLHQFRMPASDKSFERMANLLAGASGKMGVKTSQLEYTMKYAGALSKLSGVSPEQAMALAVGLGRAGLKGSTPGTSLRAILADQAAQPQYDSKGKLKQKTKSQYLQEMGVNPYNDKGQFDFFKMAEGLNKAFKGMKEKDKMAKLTQIFGKTSLTAGALIGELGKTGEDGQLSLVDIQKKLTSFTAKSVEKEINTGTNYQLKQFSSSIITLEKAIAEKLAPTLIPIVEKITKFINFLGENPAIVNLIANILLIVTPLGFILQTIGQIAFFLVTIQPIIDFIGASVLATVGLWVVAIGALIFIIYDVYQALTGGHSYLLDLGNWFNEVFANLIPNIMNVFKGWWASFWESPLANIEAFVNKMVEYFTTAIDTIKTYFGSLSSLISSLSIPGINFAADAFSSVKKVVQSHSNKNSFVFYQNFDNPDAKHGAEQGVKKTLSLTSHQNIRG